MESLEETLYTIFLRSPNNLFDEFITECQKLYEIPAHSFSEMRSRDKKITGDIFEEFCVKKPQPVLSKEELRELRNNFFHFN